MGGKTESTDILPVRGASANLQLPNYVVRAAVHFVDMAHHGTVRLGYEEEP